MTTYPTDVRTLDEAEVEACKRWNTRTAQHGETAATLKSCPFCGGADIKSESEGLSSWDLTCLQCEVGFTLWALAAYEDGHPPEEVRTMDEAETVAHERWNARTR